jgi:hypothetical protein
MSMGGRSFIALKYLLFWVWRDRYVYLYDALTGHKTQALFSGIFHPGSSQASGTGIFQESAGSPGQHPVSGNPYGQAFFGDQCIPYAQLYDQLGSFLALATYGSLILAVYGTGAIRPTVRSVVKKISIYSALQQ